jgi:hypothetical protein
MILCLSIENDTTTNYKCFILLVNAKSATASVFVVGTDGACSSSDGHCNGYLDLGQLYRYIIRINMHTNISLIYIFTIYLANYQMMFVSCNDNTTGATAYQLNAPQFTRVRVS